MYVFGAGRCRRRGSKWMRGLCLGITNPVGTVRVCDVFCVWVAVVWVVSVGSG